MNREQMIKYLANVLVLETKLYELNQICWNIDIKINELTEVLNKKPSPEYKERDNKERTGDMLSIAAYALLPGGVVFVIAYIVLHLFKGPTQSSVALCVLAALVAYGIGFASFYHDNSEIDLHYESENRRIRNENRKIYQDAERANHEIEQLEKAYSLLSQNYYSVKDTLDKLYNMNIIYSKYRNMVAIASFYEYYLSGRCSRLTGHEGAYNIYENELIGKIIIGKLDDIICRLDEIKRNQYMLYNKLTLSNQKVDRLTSELKWASDKIEDIAHNQELIEYNTDITRKNSEVIKWISVCDYLNV